MRFGDSGILKMGLGENVLFDSIFKLFNFCEGLKWLKCALLNSSLEQCVIKFWLHGNVQDF